MEVSQKLKIELPYDPAFPLLVIYPPKKKKERKENTISKRYIYPILIAALFIIAKIWKQPKCPLMDEWIKVHNGILFNHKKE